jgi:RNA polymerase sigma factor (sigma-70 family)
MRVTAAETTGADRRRGVAGAGFDEVFQEERPGLVRLAFLMTGSSAAAEELVQDAFLGLLRASASGEVVENAAAFLRVVLIRRCSTWRSRRSTEASKLELLGEPGPVGEPVVDETWDALARLRPERRTALVLRYYADLPFNDIAEMLGVPSATVRTRVHRGLADLRRELSDDR